VTHHFSNASRVARFAILTALTLAVSGCGTSTAVQVVGAAVNAALETSGLKKKDGPRTVAVRLDTGDALNSTSDGEPLALLVRIYQLKSDAGFSSLSYDQLATPAQGDAQLGNEVLHAREMMLLPGKSYTVEEQLDEQTHVIGIVALFHSPASSRWRYAFDTSNADDEGISVGLHACSMTVGQGQLTNPETAAAASRLSGVQCGS